ncbi:MAG: DUF2059 domain-containing protein [Croceitalea sp.]|nr:DUF2059 domain-containing protein [Croceitalea sp.]NNC34734.1 DUF2059 domain-containing protein [Croceitalea sp.]
MKPHKHFIFFLTLFFSLTLFSQDVELIPKVSKYLESNGTMKQYKEAYRELLNLMERQFPKSNRNSNGWLYLERNETKALAEIRDMIIPIYIKHFDEADVDDMQAFYTSDAGIQLVKDRTKLTAAQQESVNDFYDSKVGHKIKEKQQLLSVEIAGVSEYWSKDLYQTAVLLLKEE